MSAPVLDEHGRALVFDCVTGQVNAWSVPTAIENVLRGGGRYVHGETGPRMDAPAEPAPAEEPVVALVEPDVLPLPAAEIEPHAEAAAAALVDAPQAPAADADGDGHDDGNGRFVAPQPAPRVARGGRRPKK